MTWVGSKKSGLFCLFISFLRAFVYIISHERKLPDWSMFTSLLSWDNLPSETPGFIIIHNTTVLLSAYLSADKQAFIASKTMPLSLVACKFFFYTRDITRVAWLL